MSDAAEKFPFKDVAKRLYQELVQRGYDGESPESIATAYLDYVLTRERIRRGATSTSVRQDAVDYETLETLKNAQMGDSQFVETEAIFRRLGTDPATAGRYYEQLITQKAEQLSLKMSNIAKKPRPEARKICSEAITRFVSREPQITSKELLQRFKDDEDFEVGDELIRHITERDVMKISALRTALHRAKKKIRPRKK